MCFFGFVVCLCPFRIFFFNVFVSACCSPRILSEWVWLRRALSQFLKSHDIVSGQCPSFRVSGFAVCILFVCVCFCLCCVLVTICRFLSLFSLIRERCHSFSILCRSNINHSVSVSLLFVNFCVFV